MIRRRTVLIAGALAAATPATFLLGRQVEIPWFRRWLLTRRLRAVLGPVEGETAIAEFLDAFPNHSRLARLDDYRLTTFFMMSTDYFDRDRPADVPIAFLGLHDPYDTACSNYLARFESA